MRTVEARVSFGEYLQVRAAASGEPMEDTLMKMFQARGILMGSDMKPVQPADIITDPVNEVFVLRQLQLIDD